MSELVKIVLGGVVMGAAVIAGRYELDAVPLGTGGMGTVWRARDKTLGRRVAVKLIKSADEELTRRFVRESQITAELRHPGVPVVYDVGDHDGMPYLVMELVDGRTVADLVAEEEILPLAWACGIAAQACAVLAMAHRRRRVHRDLKPSNLMLCHDGTVKVLDFGLAAALEPGDLSRITTTGQQLGTVAYMAPEQIRTEQATPRTDLYALGCVLYEMLTGQPPFTGTTYEIMRGHQNRKPRWDRSARDGIPQKLRGLIDELMAKRQAARPPGAVEVFNRLAPYADGPGPLGDAVRLTRNDPVRMYASIVAGVGTGLPDKPNTRSASAVLESAATTERPSSARQGELRFARDEARTLVRVDRFNEAADVLAGAVEAAAAEDGDHDPDVLSGRLQLAELLMEGADYAGAASEFRVVGSVVADRFGPDDELALKCRLQEASCRAAVGDATEAVGLLDALISDQERVFGHDDDRPLITRLQVGRLLIEMGEWNRARRVLADLRDDLLRWRGAGHPDGEVAEDLLRSLDDPHAGEQR